ncbi:MAG: hypothetical protein JXR25_03450 [Pontiellaceae bacterium]|nr:hypothetical protein [Pontiellaceae bacterium]MBN2783859.1 hypothetical protein [Pontiellaceae bacterium]
MDMFLSSDLAMQVGDGGAIYVQQADSRWVPCESGVTNYMRGAALMDRRLLAVGSYGCILWSDDAHRFHPALSDVATGDWFEGVAASTERAVCVGDNGSVYVTADGTNWSRSVSGTTEWLRGVAYGAGAFVAVGENGTILRSSSGSSWQKISSGTGEDLNRVRRLGEGVDACFIAVGDHGTMLQSDTGNVPWIPVLTGTTNMLNDVALNDNGLLLVGDQEIRYQPVGESIWNDQINEPVSNAPSPWTYISACGDSDRWLVAGRSGLLYEGSSSNGVSYTWISDESSSHAWMWDITIQSGICVAVGDLATIKTSLDGILWAGEQVPQSCSDSIFLGVGGTSNLLIAVGSDGSVVSSHSGKVPVAVTNEIDGELVTTNLMVEGFGVVWDAVDTFTTNNLQGVAVSDDLILVCGDHGGLYSSTNATDWVLRSTPTDRFLSGVAVGAGVCVAVGAEGCVLRGTSDGAEWISIPMGTDNWIYRVRWLDGLFVAVGENGSIYSSTDGLEWQKHTSGTVRWLTDVARVENQWFIVGYQGTLLSGYELNRLTRLPLPTTKSVFGVDSLDGKLILVGIEGMILRNQIVPSTSPVDFLAYDSEFITNVDGSKMLYEIFLLGGRPDQYFDFQSSTNLPDGEWSELGLFEIYDSSGTLYLLRSGDPSEAPVSEMYRTLLSP